MRELHPIHRAVSRRAEVLLWSAIVLSVVGAASGVGATVALVIVAWRLL